MKCKTWSCGLPWDSKFGLIRKWLRVKAGHRDAVRGQPNGQGSKQGGKGESDDGEQDTYQHHVAMTKHVPLKPSVNTSFYLAPSPWEDWAAGGGGGSGGSKSRGKWEVKWRLTAAHSSGAHPWAPIKSKTKWMFCHRSGLDTLILTQTLGEYSWDDKATCRE